MNHLARVVPPRLLRPAAEQFDRLIHDTFLSTIDLTENEKEEYRADPSNWEMATLPIRLGGYGLTKLTSILDAAYFSSELQMLQYDVVAEYAPECSPIYDHLDEEVVPNTPGSVVRADFVASWDQLHEKLGDAFLELLGGKKEERDKHPEGTFRSITCLYPKGGGKGDGALGVAKRHGLDTLDDEGRTKRRANRWQSVIGAEVKNLASRNFLATTKHFAHCPGQGRGTIVSANGTSESSMQVNRSLSLKGGGAFVGAVPSDSDLTATNTECHNEMCLRSAIENEEFAIPPDNDGEVLLCPIEPKSLNKAGRPSRTKSCNKPVDTRHLLSCRYCLNGLSFLHDSMRDTFWLPLCKEVIGASVSNKEPRDVYDEPGQEDKRPKDVCWGHVPGHKLQGVDLGYTNPLRPSKSESLSRSARKTGLAAKDMEQTKSTNLSKFHVDGAAAETVIAPAVFETTGGASASANKLFTFLSKVEFPGDPKDDPALRQSRALWISRQRKRHSFQLVRMKTLIMRRKRKLIQSKRAHAVSVPKGGLSARARIDLDPLESGLPSGTRFGAEAGGDVFGGDEIASASGVADDELKE